MTDSYQATANDTPAPPPSVAERFPDQISGSTDAERIRNSVAELTPTLAERASALLEEILAAPADEQREALTVWRERLDARLDRLAEERRPKGKEALDAVGRPAIIGALPASFIRAQMDIKGNHCRCLSYVEALKGDA
jgi:hypothetical protein